MRWDLLELSTKHRFFNPVGKALLYDIVLRSHSARRRGAELLRNRMAAMKFSDVKSGWGAMKGYTCFWKGVKLFHKPDNFQQSLPPGAVASQPTSSSDSDIARADEWSHKLPASELYDGAQMDYLPHERGMETWD